MHGRKNIKIQEIITEFLWYFLYLRPKNKSRVRKAVEIGFNFLASQLHPRD